jgi:CRP/FNR family cyclic AMP-dependent transcriptional regulator
LDACELGRQYAPGEAICRQGELGDCMYVVQSGEVVVTRRGEGAGSVLALLGPGETFGEMAVLSRQPRSATVRALGHARVLTLDRRASLRRLHEDPSLASRILQQMSERVRRLDERLPEPKLPPRWYAESA